MDGSHHTWYLQISGQEPFNITIAVRVKLPGALCCLLTTLVSFDEDEFHNEAK